MVNYSENCAFFYYLNEFFSYLSMTVWKTDYCDLSCKLQVYTDVSPS